MLFMIAAFLRPGAEAQLINYHSEFNEHVGESAANVPIAGALRGPDGRRVGYLAFFEGDTIDAATTWLHDSPHYKANLYEHIDVFEYHIEVGQLS